MEIDGVGTILIELGKKSLSNAVTFEPSPRQYQGMSYEKIWGQILGRVNGKQKGSGASRKETAISEEQEGRCG